MEIGHAPFTRGNVTSAHTNLRSERKTNIVIKGHGQPRVEGLSGNMFKVR